MCKFILLTLTLLFFGGESALACMCGEKPTVAQARRNARIVFLGEAIASKYEPGAVQPNGKDVREELTMRFRVERVWKGNLAREVVLFTEQYQAPDFSISVSTCAYQFTVGKRYLVYVGFPLSDEKPRALYCTRTAEAEEAGEDLRLLGRGTKPRRSGSHAPYTPKASNLFNRRAS